MSFLREFWFPLLLCLFGVPLALLGLSQTDNGRRVCFSLSALLFCLAVLTYIWGDPVRGPFANLVRPHDAKNLTISVGTNTAVIPVSRLSDWVDLSGFLVVQNWRPLEGLSVRKTWWSGLEVKAALKDK